MLAVVLLHFLITESRPILLLYLASRTYLKDVVVYDLTSVQSSASEMNYRTYHLGNMTTDESLQSFLECVRTEGEDSLYATSGSDYEGKCVTVPATTHHINMFLNYSILCTCGIFIFVLLGLLATTGITNIGEGRYLSWTRTMASKPMYKCMSNLLLFVIVLTIGRHIMSIVSEIKDGRSHQAVLFLELYGTQLVLLAYSAYKLKAQTDPVFRDWTGAFQDLQFQRGWMSVVNETNADFTSALSLALLKAKFDMPDDLKAMLDGEDMYEVVKACVPAEAGEEADSSDDDEESAKRSIITPKQS
mmetsp:Transcript_98279/g.174986  ORF Transcript_98279/g.174986 Transcript_98279/m.174986 type:complete len:303 (-) Transcript_98279:85-993(-)|eukprot:CAMPEP_0197624400 /NCGR_PEP_ID=MMETSP1338-20131121/4054_1 /TAXON_ID=43686 ORGANISM="Pelagodinium beii, Strain RCC1491" /NCGR_SAMPLE_ID=MMETSP1338 /ASSEMBLY_ACC=CAM_ASM_000754 /LENGTH=302 /DNA_ID=CAMNT_0043194535 /DNA_START=46 /DNA_END=954 /DNA_ORIENTATION=+